MASMQDLKRRKNSVTSTQKITKAMKLVSTVKLQKAGEKAERVRPYMEQMHKTISSIMAKTGNIRHPYLTPGETGRRAVILITANRGLAGGYNANVIKLITGENFKKEELDIYALGFTGYEFCARCGYHIADYDSGIVENPTYADASALCKKVLASFEKGEVGEIHLAYTHFKNRISYVPTKIRLLPVEESKKEDMETVGVPMNYEPNPEEVLRLMIPQYITGLIYGAMVESVAAENSARMLAMDSATKNADEIISDLTLKYNRARQGAITQELTEIIAGANGIS